MQWRRTETVRRTSADIPPEVTFELCAWATATLLLLSDLAYVIATDASWSRGGSSTLLFQPFEHHLVFRTTAYRTCHPSISTHTTS